MYSIAMILAFDEAGSYILYTTILLSILDHYKCCKTMTHSLLHYLREKFNLSQRCVNIYYSTSFHYGIHFCEKLFACNAGDFNVLANFAICFFVFIIRLSFKYIVQTALVVITFVFIFLILKKIT